MHEAALKMSLNDEVQLLELEQAKPVRLAAQGFSINFFLDADGSEKQGFEMLN